MNIIRITHKLNMKLMPINVLLINVLMAIRHWNDHVILNHQAIYKQLKTQILSILLKYFSLSKILNLAKKTCHWYTNNKWISGSLISLIYIMGFMTHFSYEMEIWSVSSMKLSLYKHFPMFWVLTIFNLIQKNSEPSENTNFLSLLIQ